MSFLYLISGSAALRICSDVPVVLRITRLSSQLWLPSVTADSGSLTPETFNAGTYTLETVFHCLFTYIV